MCGRFALTLPTDAVAGWFDALVHTGIEAARYNICPTQMIPVIAVHKGTRHLTQMRWGFTPHWYKAMNDGPLLINARSETITEKPSFKCAFVARRCIIPASGFFEWQKGEGGAKLPWYIQPNDNLPLAFGGIWQAWTGPDEIRQVTCAIVTTSASDDLKKIHHREPVTLSPDGFENWLSCSGPEAMELTKHAPNDYFKVHRVGAEVNKAGQGDSSLIEPFTE